MTATVWVGVAALGGVGSVARFLLDTVVGFTADRDFPLGTLVINVSGAFLLGLLTGLAWRGSALVLAGAALLGSYTTFSTWMLETHRMREESRFAGALVNTVISLGVGLGAVALGRTVGARL